MNIVVIGSLNMDIVIPVEPYPNPGETVLGGTVQYFPGGKGLNQAIGAARQGAAVTMLGMVGTDDAGERLRSVLQQEGVETAHLDHVEGQSGLAFVHVEGHGDNRIIVSPGANQAFTVDRLAQHQSVIEQADAIMVQLEIPLPTVAWALQVAQNASVPTFLDPAPVHADLFEQLHSIDWIAPNEHEAELLTGQPIADAKSARLAAAKIQQMGARRVLLKMGAKGAFVADENGIFYQEGFSVEAVDTTAAGDVFGAAFVVDYLRTRSVVGSLRFACAAGALSTTTFGAEPSIPHREEVVQFLQDLGL